VRPHLGAAKLQKLRTLNFAELYGKLQKPKATGDTPKEKGGAGLSSRTIGHVHRLMRRVMGHAVKWGAITSNPVAAAEPPRVQAAEVEILAPAEIKTILHGLRGHRLYMIAAVGLATGMRRGEICALRWGDVDFGSGVVRVEQSLEQTKTEGLRFKPPKTKAGRRSIAIPPSFVSALRSHWRAQQEQRLTLGLGKAPDDALVFARHDGSPWPPDTLSTDWANTVRVRKLPKVSLHALRHTHASQLIAAKLDIVTVSRRLGHGDAAITLRVYAHLFGDTSAAAAEVVEKALAGALTD
jgi:integrase